MFEFIKKIMKNENLTLTLIIQDFFLSILSKQVEQSKCPFLTQNVFLDLSISLRQIRHLKIGDIIKLKILVK